MGFHTAHRLLVIGFAASFLGASFNASAQDWVNENSMNVARVEATTVEYRDDIYVFNGFKTGLQIANSVEKFDSATREWSIISTTSVDDKSAMTHNGVVRVGADVWLLGGRVGGHPGPVSDRVWIFNLNTHQWRRGPDLPDPVAAGGAALVNNKIHWIGGLDDNASCDVMTHFVYDLDEPAQGWADITAAAGIPIPRNHFSTAVFNGKIYTMGGQFGHDACPGFNTADTAVVHSFNPANNQWLQLSDMPGKNSHSEPGTFVYDNAIYTVGGEQAKNQVWKFNPNTDTWTTFRTLTSELVAPIARIIDGRLIVAGGGPIAQQPTTVARSLLVDNDPPPPSPEPEVTTEPMPVVTTEPEPEITPEPEPIITVEPEPEVTPEPEPEVIPEPITPVAGSHTPEGESLIAMEAEYFDVSSESSSHQWIHSVLANSSNDDAMVTTPDEGQLALTINDTPMLGYFVFFNHTGKHYLWVRGLGDTNASGVGTNDSIKVGLNGSVADTAATITEFPDEWTWSRTTANGPIATLNIVDAGVNMINFWMREDGFAFDKFVITSDPDFVPTGFGPDATDGTDNFVVPGGVTDSDMGDVESVEEMDAEDTEALDTEQVSAESGLQNSNSSGGFFGSASFATLFALLMMAFFQRRVGRSRQ